MKKQTDKQHLTNATPLKMEWLFLLHDIQILGEPYSNQLHLKVCVETN